MTVLMSWWLAADLWRASVRAPGQENGNKPTSVNARQITCAKSANRIETRFDLRRYFTILATLNLATRGR